MYETMRAYWTAVRETFPDAWGLPPTESRLMHSAGIQAMGVLMDRLVQRVERDQNFQQNIQTALKRIKADCAWTEGQWSGLGMDWNEIQNVSKHIRLLAEHLVQLEYAASRGDE